jgi:hypothetical protein
MSLQRMGIRARRRSKAAVLQYYSHSFGISKNEARNVQWRHDLRCDTFRTGNRCDYSHSKLRCPWNSGVEPATALFIRRIYEEASLPLNLGLTPPCVDETWVCRQVGSETPSTFSFWPKDQLATRNIPQSSFSVGKLFDWTISTTVLPHEPT